MGCLTSVVNARDQPSSTISGQATPIGSRLAPVMFATAYSA